MFNDRFCDDCGEIMFLSYYHDGPPQLHTPPRYALNEISTYIFLGCGRCGATGEIQRLERFIEHFGNAFGYNTDV